MAMMPQPLQSDPQTRPLSGWLQRLVYSFHSGHRAIPLRSNRLLEQLQAEAEIVAGAARLLLEGMKSAKPESVVLELGQCLETIWLMDQELAASLRRTIVTPIDAADIQLLSGHCVRLVRHQLRIARMIAAEGGNGLAALQQPVVDWGERFACTIAQLPARTAVREAESMRSLIRQALYRVRNDRSRQMTGATGRRDLMQGLVRLDVFEEVVDQMKLVHADVARVLRKSI